jgi:hypothetical protein
MLIKKIFIKIQNQVIYQLNIENLKFIKIDWHLKYALL